MRDWTDWVSPILLVVWALILWGLGPRASVDVAGQTHSLHITVLLVGAIILLRFAR